MKSFQAPHTTSLQTLPESNPGYKIDLTKDIALQNTLGKYKNIVLISLAPWVTLIEWGLRKRLKKLTDIYIKHISYL